MSAQKILIIDDEEHIRELALLYLEREGFECQGLPDGSQVIKVVEQFKPELIVLDLMLPGVDGLTLCREIRQQSSIPIIILSARDEITDKVVGLELGADDYLTKPFHPQELVARAKALLRRSTLEPDQPRLLQSGNLTIDLERHEVRSGERLIQLRPKEFDLISLLIQHPGRVFQRNELLDQVWGYDFPGYTRTVDVHVQQLRDKLTQGGVADLQITTVWGVGYKLEAVGLSTV
ncbi:MAG: response regulator [Candidatus Dormibacteraceae bacterium]